MSRGTVRPSPAITSPRRVNRRGVDPAASSGAHVNPTVRETFTAFLVNSRFSVHARSIAVARC